MGKKNRQRGRSARKRTNRQHRNVIETDPWFQDYLLELEQKLGRLLADNRETKLSEYRAELERRSQSLLDESGCWLFLAERLREARTYGIEDDLRALVREFAAKFASGCGSIRFTRLYEKKHRGGQKVS